MLTGLEDARTGGTVADNSDHSDIDLANRAAAGNQSAAEALERKYSRLVYFIAYRILADEQQAQDITQETFIKLFRQLKLGRLRPDATSLKTWIGSIARNCAIDALRRKRRWQDLEQQNPVDDENQELEHQGNHPDPERIMLGKERLARLKLCLGTLAPRHRDVVRLLCVQGFSVGEVADALGVSKNAVSTARNRGLRALRNCLEEGQR